MEDPESGSNESHEGDDRAGDGQEHHTRSHLAWSQKQGDQSPLGKRRGVPDKVGGYSIRRQIGSGGMGTVYLAHQEQPRRVVALKVMRSGIASKSALRRFEFESQILARLRHPNVAQVYEAGTHDDGHGKVVEIGVYTEISV